MSIWEWRDNGGYFNYRGYKIYYVTEGEGTPLLLLHGFPTSSYDWHKVWPELTTHFRVMAFDFIGFGFSHKPKHYPYSLMDQADLAIALCQTLNITKSHILAHDYGDTVAQELLARQIEGSLPFKIISTTLLNGGLFPGVHKPRLIQKLLMTPVGPILARLYQKKNLRKTFNEIFGPKTQPTGEEIDEFWEIMNYNQGKLVIHFLIRYMAERVTYQRRWLKALQEASCPIRLIDGAIDPISGLHLVKHYQKVIPNPDCIVLEEIEHYPQVEAPDKVLEAFLKFVKGVDSEFSNPKPE